MNERERLIELLKNGKKYAINTMVYLDIDEAIDTSYDDLQADYLLENGVVVLPCKVGDTVYKIVKNCIKCSYYTDDIPNRFCQRESEGNPFNVDYDKDCTYKILEVPFTYNQINNIDRTVFLTKEEAEKALKGGAANE